MSATGDGLSAEAREQLGFPPERRIDVEAQLAELRASRAGRGVDGGGDVDGAKALLEANGYVVLKAASYRKAQERQRIAECVRDGEIDRRKSVEAWAHESFDEQRRLRDRLTFVYGVARAHGVTVEDLAGAQDWTGPDVSGEVKALFQLYEQHGHGNWPEHYPQMWALLAAVGVPADQEAQT